MNMEQRWGGNSRKQDICLDVFDGRDFSYTSTQGFIGEQNGIVLHSKTIEQTSNSETKERCISFYPSFQA
jgi:hypothetical protein